MVFSVVDTKNDDLNQSDLKKGQIETIKKRADFISVSKGVYKATPSFVLQCQSYATPAQSDRIYVGYTATKRVGNAVARNRAKRRLRALVAGVFPLYAKPEYRYVLIARKDTTACTDFQKMWADLKLALSKVHERIA